MGSGVEAGHAAKVDALRRKIVEADTEKASRELLASAAARSAKEMSDSVKAAQMELEGAEVATKAAGEAQKVALSEQKVGDADLIKAEDQKALAEKVVSEDLVPLRQGTAA